MLGETLLIESYSHRRLTVSRCLGALVARERERERVRVYVRGSIK